MSGIKSIFLILVLSLATAGAAPLIQTSTTGGYSVYIERGENPYGGWEGEMLVNKAGTFQHPTELNFTLTFPIPGTWGELSVHGRSVAGVSGGNVYADSTGTAWGPVLEPWWEHEGVNYRISGHSDVAASALLEDELTIYGTGPGTRLLVNASVSSGHSQFQGGHGMSWLAFGAFNPPHGGGRSFYFEEEYYMDFVPGVAIPLSMSAIGYGNGHSDRNDQTNYGYGSASINSIRVLDAAGAEVHGYRYKSATGMAYDQFVGGAQTPEPGTFALMGFGAMSLFVWCRSKV